MHDFPIAVAAHPLKFDDGPARRRVGLLLLATDHTSERDFARLVASDDVVVYAARIAYENPTTPDNLRKMQSRLSEGVGLILPGEELDAVCFSCTAASVIIGDEEVAAAIHRAKFGVPVVTPPNAARAGLRALGVRSISILTPYTVDTSTPLAHYFVRHGFDVTGLTCLGLDDDRAMARITPETIMAAASNAVAPDAEALFISCTALRAAQIAARIEAKIGRPVVTSNLATAWMCRRLVGFDSAPCGGAKLLDLPLPAADT
jgi:maleate isomerase